MGLESASFLNGLMAMNPTAADGIAQGDDHIRLIKAVLKASFPNITYARYLEQDRVDVADAATPALWAAASNYCNLLGATTKTGFSGGTAGQIKLVRIDTAMTLTHHSTSLNLPGSADIDAVQGDHMIVVCRGSGNALVLSYFRDNGQPVIEALPPIGAMYSWPTNTPPARHMARNGSAISRTTYSALFAVIGTTYGSGDGSTTFNLPNHMGAFERNVALGSTRDPDRASRTARPDGTVGDNVGTWQADANKSHNHGVTDPGHAHATSINFAAVAATNPGSNIDFVRVRYEGGATSPATTGITIQNSGGNEARPINVAVLPIIRVI